MLNGTSVAAGEVSDNHHVLADVTAETKAAADN